MKSYTSLKLKIARIKNNRFYSDLQRLFSTPASRGALFTAFVTSCIFSADSQTLDSEANNGGGIAEVKKQIISIPVLAKEMPLATIINADQPCNTNDEAPKLQLDIALSSSFPRYATLNLTFDSRGAARVLKIAGNPTAFTIENELIFPSLQKFCNPNNQMEQHNYSQGQDIPRLVSVPFSDVEVDALTTFLGNNLFPCQTVKPQSASWHCQIENTPSLQKEIARTKSDFDHVFNLRKNVYRWKRISYAFAKKLTFSRSLYNGGHRRSPENLDLCKPIVMSELSVLPISFQKKEFVNYLCEDQKAEPWIDIASALAAAELDWLESIIRASTKTGLITPQLKEKSGGTRRYDTLLQLEPTSELFAEENKKITETTMNKGCQLNLLSSNSPHATFLLNYLATKYLPSLTAKINNQNTGTALNGGEPTLKCDSVASILRQEMNNYWFQNTASTSLFEVTNLRSKLIRLPRGTYKYNVFIKERGIDYVDAEKAQPDYSASFSWSGNRPRVKIH